jgi:3',5'-cyclic AMP phosphodiesterase CpdA
MGTAKKYVGYLTENQLHWLEQDLASVPKGSTVVVSLHIPTNTGHARRNKLKEEELGGTVANRRQLYKMLEPFQAHIMSGHTHVNEKWEEGNIIEHVHGTVCGAWWTGPFVRMALQVDMACIRSMVEIYLGIIKERENLQVIN